MRSLRRIALPRHLPALVSTAALAAGCVAPVTASPNFAAARPSISTVAVLPADVRLTKLLGVQADPGEPSAIAVALHSLVSDALRARGFEIGDPAALDAHAVATAMNEFALAGVGARNLSPRTQKHRDELARLSPPIAMAAAVDAIAYVRVGGYFTDSRTKEPKQQPITTFKTLEVALVDGRSGEILWAGTSTSPSVDEKSVRAAFASFPAAPTDPVAAAIGGTAGEATIVAAEPPETHPVPDLAVEGSSVHLKRASFRTGGMNGVNYTQDHQRPVRGLLAHGNLRLGMEAPESLGIALVVEGSIAHLVFADARCREDAEPCADEPPDDRSQTLALVAARFGFDARIAGMELGAAALVHPELRDAGAPAGGPEGVYPNWSTTVRLGPSVFHAWFDFYAGQLTGLQMSPDAAQAPVSFGLAHRSRAFAVRMGGGSTGYVADLSFPFGSGGRVGVAVWVVESGDFAATTGFSFPIGKARRVGPMYGAGATR